MTMTAALASSSCGRGLPRVPVAAIAGVIVAVALLAGAIHIAAILLVPEVARADGWSRLVRFAGEEQFTEVPVVSRNRDGVLGLDPLFVNGACRLNLAEEPAGVTIEASERFWSVALYDPDGIIVFSLNDRTAVDGRLDMTVVNPAQSMALQRARPAEFQQLVVVESQSNDLIAILRLFAPNDIARAQARRALAAAECLPAPIESPAR